MTKIYMTLREFETKVAEVSQHSPDARACLAWRDYCDEMSEKGYNLPDEDEALQWHIKSWGITSIIITAF